MPSPRRCRARPERPLAADSAIGAILALVVGADPAAVRVTEQFPGPDQVIRSGYFGDHLIYTHEIHHNAVELPLRGFGQPLRHAIQLTGRSGTTTLQLGYEADGAVEPGDLLLARALVDAASAVAVSPAGVLVSDPASHFKLDDRIHSA